MHRLQGTNLQRQSQRLRFSYVMLLLMAGWLYSDFLQGQDEVRALGTKEIQSVFADVLDKAEVLDTVGVQAETRWYADGYFETRWWSVSREGRAAGRWMARDNKRCVLLSDPLTLVGEGWQCAKILQQPYGFYLSLNPDGTRHGLHQLVVLPDLSKPLHPSPN